MKYNQYQLQIQYKASVSKQEKERIQDQTIKQKRGGAF